MNNTKGNLYEHWQIIFMLITIHTCSETTLLQSQSCMKSWCLFLEKVDWKKQSAARDWVEWEIGRLGNSWHYWLEGHVNQNWSVSD